MSDDSIAFLHTYLLELFINKYAYLKSCDKSIKPFKLYIHVHDLKKKKNNNLGLDDGYFLFDLGLSELRHVNSMGKKSFFN